MRKIFFSFMIIIPIISMSQNIIINDTIEMGEISYNPDSLISEYDGPFLRLTGKIQNNTDSIIKVNYYDVYSYYNEYLSYYIEFDYNDSIYKCEGQYGPNNNKGFLQVNEECGFTIDFLMVLSTGLSDEGEYIYYKTGTTRYDYNDFLYKIIPTIRLIVVNKNGKQVYKKDLSHNKFVIIKT